MKKRQTGIIIVLLSVLLLLSVMVTRPYLAAAVGLSTGPYYPATAYDPELNRYLVVYQDVQYGDLEYSYYIYGQFVRLDGALAGDPFPISEAGNSRHGPSIARAYDGRFLVVWDADDPVTTVKIVGQFLYPDGTLDGSNFVISDAISFKVRPKVASSPDYGRFLVVWDDDRNWETSGTDIFGQLVADDGTLAETASDVNFAVTNAPESQYEASVAYDSTNGRFMVVWLDYRDLANSDVYGQLVNADWGGIPPRGSHYLTASDENFPISTEPTDYQFVPAVAFDDVNNRFLVVWNDCRDQGACTDIYGQLVNGYFTGSEDVIDYYGTDPDVNFLVLDGAAGIGDMSIEKDDCNGGFVMVWADNRSTTTYDIYGALLNEDGTLNGSDFVISQSANDEFLPSVAVNGNCGALVAFEDQDPSANLLGLVTIGGLADIIVSPSPVDFGNVTPGDSSTQEISIQNNGDADLTLTSTEILGTNAGMFDIVSGGNDPCGELPVVLAPGLSCTMDVTFTPTSGGDKTATLRIHSNDPETPSTDVTLNGTGLAYTKVEVLSPNGGERFATGMPVPISWEAPASAAKFKLFYSLDNGVTWVAVTKDYLTQKSYGWTAPLLTANKKSCRVKVVGYNSKNVSVGSDRSDSPFAIEVVILTSPNGGETFSSAGTEVLTWTLNPTKKPVASIKLYYTKNNGTTWTPIETLAGPAVEYEWTTIPTVTTPKTKCKVKIVLKSSTGATLGSDVSDAVFTISNEK
jgi:hypothetical protein